MKRLICLAGAVIGAAGVSQVPEFSQQYAQRLGGAIDELSAVIARFDADAAASGLSRTEGLERYSGSPDAFLVDRGQSMEAVFTRHGQFVAQRRAFDTAAPLEKLPALTRYFDTDVGAAALEDYEPAIPVTAEGLAYAAIGLGLGYSVVWTIWTLIAAPFRRRREAPKVRAH
ncbi:DUF2937 family protein [Pelagibacterium sediminicola]|uniref:DUF2937 family protein n=1 Tax=Pelagibacterium sediminicola TaxID=2248761 RepID=UPI0013002A58|nr:DUF2937 family protein [Pelagibacterium sediminicola]